MRTVPGTTLDRLLTLSLACSLGLTLVSSVLYALLGWDSPPAALLHIVGGALGGILVVRVVTWLDRLAPAVLVVGMLGAAGVVGYGFNTITVGLGGLDLIDASGPATILKVLGLFWPLTLLLAGIGLWNRVPRWCAAGIVVGALAFPVSRIANIGWLAVLVDLVLLGCLVAVPSVLRGVGSAQPEPVH
ncbi:hypothetical protein [Pseudonocardia xishanensis]|uniref:Uncharacterized protein n=1 Tax=Pseudonocardia xishanensis TaxID=630995 RepID=A0ABP8RH89_9PSEU